MAYVWLLSSNNSFLCSLIFLIFKFVLPRIQINIYDVHMCIKNIGIELLLLIVRGWRRKKKKKQQNKIKKERNREAEVCGIQFIVYELWFFWKFKKMLLGLSILSLFSHYLKYCIGIICNLFTLHTLSLFSYIISHSEVLFFCMGAKWMGELDEIAEVHFS